MSKAVFDIVCTCSNPEVRFDHDADCGLWDHPDFAAGRASWNPVACVIEDDDFWDQEETQDAPDDGIDAIHMACQLLAGDDEAANIYVAVEGLLGEDLTDLFMCIANGFVNFSAEEMERLEAWGLTQHVTPDADSLPLYDCLCYTNRQPAVCEECGVRLGKVDENPVYVPTLRRLVREIAMWVQGDLYGCTHNKGLVCVDCGVQRVTGGTKFWTYYDNEGAAAESSSVSKALTAVVGSVDDDWDYYEYWSTGAGGTTVSQGTTGGTTTFQQKCRHYSQEVVFPDGTKIWASSSHTRKPEEQHPDFGVYMFDTWPNTCLAYKLRWADFGLPHLSDEDVLYAADHALEIARSGRIVEIGCMGGHGRTGSFMAVMLLRAGFTGTADEAVDWVHANYCDHAIEGAKQEWYVASIHAQLNGLEVPRQPCSYSDHRSLFDKNETCDCKDWAKDHETLSKPKTFGPFGGNTNNGIVDYKAPVYDSTPVPAKPGGQGVCSLRRHAIMYWRHEECDCKFWVNDLGTFEKDKISRRSQPLVSNTP